MSYERFVDVANQALELGYRRFELTHESAAIRKVAEAVLVSERIELFDPLAELDDLVLQPSDLAGQTARVRQLHHLVGHALNTPRLSWRHSVIPTP